MSAVLTDAFVIVDDVLTDPMAYRQRALSGRFQVVEDGAVQFRGIQACADPTVPLWLVQHWPTLQPVTSFFRLSPKDQPEPHTVHSDTSMGTVTAILYLTPDPPAGDGTDFLKRRTTGAIASMATVGSPEWEAEALAWFDPTQWAVWQHVPAAWNRMVVFPAAWWHSRAILENYGDTPESARLTQVVFCQGEFI